MKQRFRFFNCLRKCAIKGVLIAGSCSAVFASFAGNSTITPESDLWVHVLTSTVNAHGTWASTSYIRGGNAKQNFDPGIINTTDLSCWVEEKTCWEADARVDEHNILRSDLIRYEIKKWTDREVTAESENPCYTIEVRFGVGTKEVIKTIRSGGALSAKACADEIFDATIVLKLMSPDDAANYAKSRAH